jgi:hypothetical protein
MKKVWFRLRRPRKIVRFEGVLGAVVFLLCANLGRFSLCLDGVVLGGVVAGLLI